MVIPCNDGIRVNAYIDEAWNYADFLLVEMTPYMSIVYTGEELYTYHVLYVMMWTFHIIIDIGGISTSVF